MIRIMLNISKRDNFVFFDPENKIHLNLSNPVGYITKITGSLKRALVVGAVIDVDNETGVEIPERVAILNDKILKAFKVARKTKVAVEEKEEIIIEEETAIEEPKKEALSKKRKGGKK